MNIDLPAMQRSVARAGFAPSQWPATLEDLRLGLGARLVAVIRTLPDSAELLGPPELTDAHFASYTAGAWFGRDPRAAKLTKVAPGQIYLDADVLAPEIIARDDFYRDFAATEDVPHAAFWSVKDATGDYAFSAMFSREHGPATGEELQVLASLQQSINGAIALSSNIHLARDHGVLDGLAALGGAAIALGREGEVVEATPAGQICLSKCFQLRGKRLTVADRDAAAKLDALIQSFSNPITDVDVGAFNIPNSGRRGLLCIPARNAGAGLDIFRNVRGVLVLKDLDSPVAAQPDLLHSIYGLTPAEIEVANQIAEGASPELISQTRHVAITTTRAMLRSVFHKTGVTRQSELAALIARLA